MQEQSSDEAFEEYGIRPSIQVELEGGQLDSLTIEAVPDDDPFLSREVPGFIGNAFDFQVEGDFTTAAMTFEFPPSLLDDPETIPAIYYFGEEEQMLYRLENQVLDGNQITATVDHFSRYMLVKEEIFEKVWKYEFVEESGSGETFENPDIAFVIDASGSMVDNDPDGIRKKVTNEFIDRMRANDRAAVISFSTANFLHSSFTSDKGRLKKAVDQIRSVGGTLLTVGVKSAI